MSDNGRIAVLFGCNVLLYFLAGELNNALSGIALYLQIDTLLIIFFGLYVNRFSGLFYTMLLGFLTESAHLAPNGTYVFGYLGLWLFFIWCQGRIRRQNQWHVRFVAAVGQILFMLSLGIILGRELVWTTAYFARVLFDTLLSALAVFILAWPWCKFQNKLLYSLGWNLEAQMRHH